MKVKAIRECYVHGRHFRKGDVVEITLGADEKLARHLEQLDKPAAKPAKGARASDDVLA